MDLGIGIDPGYEFCGLTCVELERPRIVNYMTIETTRTPDLIVRLHRVYDALKEQLTHPDIRAVGYENPLRTAAGKSKRHQTNSSSLILHIVVGYIHAICWDNDIRLESFEPQEVKNAVLGKGNGDADKEQVRHMIKVLTGNAMNEHEADSAATAFALRQRLSKQSLYSRLNA